MNTQVSFPHFSGDDRLLCWGCNPSRAEVAGIPQVI